MEGGERGFSQRLLKRNRESVKLVRELSGVNITHIVSTLSVIIQLAVPVLQCLSENFFMPDTSKYQTVPVYEEIGKWKVFEVTYEKVDAREKTCCKNGNIEYYKGSDGKCYVLKDGVYTETTPEDTIIEAGHSYGAPEWAEVLQVNRKGGGQKLARQQQESRQKNYALNTALQISRTIKTYNDKRPPVVYRDHGRSFYVSILPILMCIADTFKRYTNKLGLSIYFCGYPADTPK